MATKLTHGTTTSATGVVAVSFAASPVGGANYQASLGTATAATIELQVRVGATWLVAGTLTLSAGTPTGNVPVYPPYEAARWNVTSVTGGSVALDSIGVGV